MNFPSMTGTNEYVPKKLEAPICVSAARRAAASAPRRHSMVSFEDSQLASDKKRDR
jgi:hypothetical protein